MAGRRRGKPRADIHIYCLRVDLTVWRGVLRIATREGITVRRLLAAILSDAIARDTAAILAGARIPYRDMTGSPIGERMPRGRRRA